MEKCFVVGQATDDNVHAGCLRLQTHIHSMQNLLLFNWQQLLHKRARVSSYTHIAVMFSVHVHVRHDVMTGIYGI